MAQATLDQVADAIAHCMRRGAVIAVLTGAGISKASGIPDFRGHEGLWGIFRPEDVATAHVLDRNPELFWRFHDHLREILINAVPNPGHFVVAEMEEELADDVEVQVITENIDGLHQRAGSLGVIELHGNAIMCRCTACGTKVPELPFPAPSYPPRCEVCNGVIRPNLVLFDEPLPEEAVEAATELTTSAEVVLVIGTSLVAEPIAYLPFFALACRRLVVEINPEPTTLTGAAQYSVQATPAAALATLWERLRARLG